MGINVERVHGSSALLDLDRRFWEASKADYFRKNRSEVDWTAAGVYTPAVCRWSAKETLFTVKEAEEEVSCLFTWLPPPSDRFTSGCS